MLTQYRRATAAIFLGASATVPASAFATDYVTAEQAQKLLFADAATFTANLYTLDATQLAALTLAAGLPARSAAWRVVHALDASGRRLGSVVIDNVVGKFELITYAVGIDRSGAVQGIEILSYRESHGSEIRLPAWRKQFVGKTLAQPLKIGDDIALISGATLSCSHVTDGVRRITAVLAVLKEAGLLPA